jgi:hypothetical protein
MDEYQPTDEDLAEMLQYFAEQEEAALNAEWQSFIH